MNNSPFLLSVSGNPATRSFTASVVSAEGDTLAEHTFEWRVDSTALALDLGTLAHAATSGEPSKDDLHVRFGKQLYQAVFGGPVGKLWQAQRNQAGRKPLPLVICVDLAPELR